MVVPDLSCCLPVLLGSASSFFVYIRRRQPTARVPSVARGTIFNGTMSELKYSNYDLIKKLNF
jgi:hypothetical protein